MPYRWELPGDPAPARDVIRAAVAGELIEAWGGQAPDDAGTVKHQVARLRRKLEGSGVRIKTVRARATAWWWPV